MFTSLVSEISKKGKQQLFQLTPSEKVIGLILPQTWKPVAQREKERILNKCIFLGYK